MSDSADFRRDDRVEALLRLAGWTPERRVDVTLLLAQLAKIGYPTHGMIGPVLENFCGIVAQSKVPGIDAKFETAVSFGVRRNGSRLLRGRSLADAISGAPSIRDANDARFLETIVGTPVCIIGYVYERFDSSAWFWRGNVYADCESGKTVFSEVDWHFLSTTDSVRSYLSVVFFPESHCQNVVHTILDNEETSRKMAQYGLIS